MQNKIQSLGYYPVEDITTAYSGAKIYGVDPGHYAGWTWGVNNNQPSGDVFEEVYAGTWQRAWHKHFDKHINPNKYYDGDWKWVEKDGEKHLAKTVKKTVDNPRGTLKFRGITPWES